MSTTTTRLGLYKPASDGSELVNVVTDLNNNLDAIDLAIGSRIVTSSTRPSTPYGGQGILESDTTYRSYVHNGTAPASGGWIEIPNGSATYGSQVWASRATNATTLRIANTFGGGNTAAAVLTEHAAAAGIAYGGRVSGDSQDRIQIRADGRIDVGPGSGARDTNLYRSAADTLKTDDSFVVGSTLAVTGAATLASTLAVAGASTLTGAVTLGGSIVTLASSTAEDTTARTTASTSLVTVSGLSAPTITAPPSGKIKVTLVVMQRNSGAFTCTSSFRAVGSTSGTRYSETVTGGTQFSGTNNGLSTKVYLVTGCTPGETVTVTAYHQVNGGTGTWDYRYLLLEAMPA